MTGQKKIVGLWRDSATNQERDKQAPVESAASASASARETGASAERDWLDMSALAQAEESYEVEDLAPSWGERIVGGLLLVAGIAWVGFALFIVSRGFVRPPAMADWPATLATIAMPLTLLAVLWVARTRSSRSEKARFANIIAALREENLTLSRSMQSLGLHLHLADAQKQLIEQTNVIRQVGLDTAQRLNESSDRLASKAAVIANANDHLSQSGDVAMQRMDGLLAGLPRIDDVAQRLAVNFREAGLVAHQQGASLEARLAALAEEAAKAAQTGEASAASLHDAIGALRVQAQEAETGLLAASAKVSDVHGAALAQVSSAAVSARSELTATVTTLKAQMDESWRAFREGVDASATQLDARLAAAREAGDAIGIELAGHGEASDALAARIGAHVADVQARLEALDISVSASTGVIGRAIDDGREKLTAFMDQVASGNVTAHELIGHAESLLLALDAVTRELDETLPHALSRMVTHGQTTQTALSQLKPMLEASELVAQSTLSHVNAVKSALQSSQEQMTSQADSQQALAARLRAALTEADAALDRLRSGTDEFAEQGGARLIATFDDVRATAQATADEARQTLDRLVTDAGEIMRTSAGEAIDTSFKTQIAAQLADIEAASQRAVAAADSAAERLMQQVAVIMDRSAHVEQRVLEAEQAIAASDRDSLAKQVGLLTEGLKSTAIDVTKILSAEVSDSAWGAYLKGDRGVFARRAVKLVENSEAKEILRFYQEDDAFHAAVNQFIHDFEAILRLLIGARDGSAISVTLLSSDIGKLYVALAQAIDRLRN
jgi:hypothetical protein